MTVNSQLICALLLTNEQPRNVWVAPSELFSTSNCLSMDSIDLNSEFKQQVMC